LASKDVTNHEGVAGLTEVVNSQPVGQAVTPARAALKTNAQPRNQRSKHQTKIAVPILK
jgi:hypothetical protein